jgi:hypothetical protein
MSKIIEPVSSTYDFEGEWDRAEARYKLAQEHYKRDHGQQLAELLVWAKCLEGWANGDDVPEGAMDPWVYCPHEEARVAMKYLATTFPTVDRLEDFVAECNKLRNAWLLDKSDRMKEGLIESLVILHREITTFVDACNIKLAGDKTAIAGQWSKPHSLRQYSTMLKLDSVDKAKTALKDHGLKPVNRQAWIVRLDTLPANWRKALGE